MAITLYAHVGIRTYDVFTYTLTDGDGNSTAATLTINLEDNLSPLVKSAERSLVQWKRRTFQAPTAGTFVITASGKRSGSASGLDTDTGPGGFRQHHQRTDRRVLRERR